MKRLRITVNNRVYDVIVEVIEDTEREYMGSFSGDISYTEKHKSEPEDFHKSSTSGEKNVVAPIVGRVTKIFVKEGDSVKKDQPLIILDAMKMDTYINSPEDGKVEKIKCKVGDGVSVGDVLLTYR